MMIPISCTCALWVLLWGGVRIGLYRFVYPAIKNIESIDICSLSVSFAPQMIYIYMRHRNIEQQGKGPNSVQLHTKDENMIVLYLREITSNKQWWSWGRSLLGAAACPATPSDMSQSLVPPPPLVYPSRAEHTPPSPHLYKCTRRQSSKRVVYPSQDLKQSRRICTGNR